MLPNVLHLTSTPRGLGGVEQFLIDAAPVFAASTLNVSYVNVFADNDTGPFPKALTMLGVRALNLPASGLQDVPGVLKRLVRMLRQWEIGILHMHMYHATVLGSAAARLARVPASVITRHYLESGYIHRPRPAQWLDTLAVRSAHRVVAVSKAVRDDVVDRIGVDPARVSVICNGVSITRLSSGLPIPRRSAGVVLGTVGSLVPWKGHADLVMAFARALKDDASLSLVIVGEGPERAPLEALIRTLGIAHKVSLPGFSADVPGLLHTLDVYVHPSRDEAQGVAILEAMAAGKPVVATNVGGIPDMISDPDVGMLVEAGDTAAMAAAILQLSGDADLRARLGARARQHVQSRFSIEHIVRQYRELYESLAKTTMASPPRSARRG